MLSGWWASQLGRRATLWVRIRPANWTGYYTLSNDWSYNGSNQWVAADHVTLYYDGQLIFGTEPG